MTIGDYIKQLRQVRGISGSELANYSGVSRGFIHNLENKGGDISLDTAGSIARGLGMSLTDFICGYEKKEISLPAHYQAGQILVEEGGGLVPFETRLKLWIVESVDSDGGMIIRPARITKNKTE